MSYLRLVDLLALPVLLVVGGCVVLGNLSVLWNFLGVKAASEAPILSKSEEVPLKTGAGGNGQEPRITLLT